MVMTRINKYLIMILLLITWGCNSSSQDRKLLGVDVRLFQNTPAWKLAQAIEKEDTVKIRRLIKKNTTLLNFQEPTYGQSVVHWAVGKDCYYATRVLLDLGADPNQKAYDSTTAFIKACSKSYDEMGFLQLLLAYGGDVNTIANTKSALNCTPLIAAATTKLERVKILVNAGADIDCYCSNNNQSAVYEAAILAKIDILYYLIIEKGADYSRPVMKRIDGTTLYIVDFVEDMNLRLISEEKIKLQKELLEYMRR